MGTLYKMSPEALKETSPQYTVIFENQKTKKTFEENFVNEFFFNRRMNRVNRGRSLRATSITKHF